MKILTLSNTKLQAMFIAFFFMIVFMLRIGLSISTNNMPDWARTIPQVTPFKHFVGIIRLAVLKGSGIAYLHLDFFILSYLS